MQLSKTVNKKGYFSASTGAAATYTLSPYPMGLYSTCGGILDIFWNEKPCDAF